MRKVLVAGHGHLPSGFKSAVELLTGEQPGLTALDCYVDGSDWTVQLQAWLDGLAPDDEALILTDVLGGSVCQRVAAAHPETHGAAHVTGTTLGLLIEAVLGGERFSSSWLEQTIAAAREGTQLVVLPDVPQDAGDDAFFD